MGTRFEPEILDNRGTRRQIDEPYASSISLESAARKGRFSTRGPRCTLDEAGNPADDFNRWDPPQRRDQHRSLLRILANRLNLLPSRSNDQRFSLNPNQVGRPQTDTAK